MHRTNSLKTLFATKFIAVFAVLLFGLFSNNIVQHSYAADFCQSGSTGGCGTLAVGASCNQGGNPGTCQSNGGQPISTGPDNFYPCFCDTTTTPPAPATGPNGSSSTVFGTIRQPAGTERFGGAGQIGILAFVSLLIRIFTIIAGLIVLFNFIISGYTYLTSEGNPKAHETVKNRITYSVIGIVIIVSAYTITALLSLIFFGSATFILNPTIAPPTP